MSSRCFLCSALGNRDTEDTSVATTRSREEIERHVEIHRKQIQFMIQEDANAVESGEGSKESGAQNGTSRNGGERRSGDPEKRKALEDHCRSIPLNSDTRGDNGVYCNLCKSAKAVRRGQHLNVHFVFRHAQSHLAKMTYACRHCERRASTEDTIRLHLKSQHNIVKDLTDHFDDESDDHLEEIKEMITKCFDPRSEPSGQQVSEVPKDSTSSKSVRIKETTLEQSNKIERHISKIQNTPMEVEKSNQKETIDAHCRIVLPKRQRDCDAFALCNLCREKRSVYSSSGSVRASSALRHVQLHLTRSFYFCKLCDGQFTRIDCMQHHLRESHQCVSSNADDYEDTTGEFTQEIKDKITECFGQKMTSRSTNKDPLHSQRVKPKIIGSTSRDAQSLVQFEKRPTHVPFVKSKITVTKYQYKPSLHDRLARIRQDHCWRLVQNVKNLGRIQCKQCNIPVPFSTIHSSAPDRLRSHALGKHLPKLAVYHCRMCTFKTAVYGTMKAHLKCTHHSVSCTGKFDNRENDFHEEIMTELSACFHSTESKCTSENARNVTKRTYSSINRHRRPIMDHHTGVMAGPMRKGLTPSTSRQVKDRDPFVRKIIDQCNNLICKMSPTAQTIDCQLCSKVLAVKVGRANYTWSLIHHVEAAHFQKASYGCRRCHLRFVSIHSMTNHLSGQHKLASITGQYVYFAEENHEELISLLKKCFDREFADSNDANQATAAVSVFAAVETGPTTDDSPPAKGKPEDDGSNASTSKEILTTRLNRYKCQVCPSTFVYELIYKKHMALFHSGAS